MSYNLIDNLKEQGWEFLIPGNLDIDSSGDYVNFETLEDGVHANNSNDLFGRYEPDVWDVEDEYVDNEEENEDEFEFRDITYYDNPSSSLYDTLYDLKYEVDCDEMSDDDFLSMSVGSLLGVTNAQLKFISKKAIRDAGLGKYKDLLRVNTDSIQSVEQRIKYVNVISQVNFGAHMIPRQYSNKENIKKYNKYIQNIVFKHSEDEAIKLLSWHKDYMTMLRYASIINEEHKINEETYFDYVLFPKVSHIKDLHDKASRDYSTYISRRAAERKEETNYLISNFISSNVYKRYLYKGKSYSVIAVENVDAIIEEANNLKHCVASYIDDFAKGESYLYFIRSNKALDRSLYTVELLKDDVTGIMYLNQCYGYKDTTEKSEELKKFIYRWCKEKKLNIDCPI